MSYGTFAMPHNCGKKIAAEINENRGECGSNKDLRGSILRFGQAAEEYFEQIDSRNGKDPIPDRRLVELHRLCRNMENSDKGLPG